MKHYGFIVSQYYYSLSSFCIVLCVVFYIYRTVTVCIWVQLRDLTSNDLELKQ